MAYAGYALALRSARRPTLPEVPLAQRKPVTDERIYNDEASVPPQCYTKTEGRHNVCYTCHQIYDRSVQDRLNRLDDGALQGEYAFSEVGVTNHWSNLFVDRRQWLASISDRDIRAYVDGDNYSPLAGRLRERGWKGFVPDLGRYEAGASAFDAQGLARDGSHWVAFNYKPFPGTFWPTNGSTDDVVVRLPRAFREVRGQFSRDVYFVNLTLVELGIKNLERASIWPVDERQLEFDVDGDGALSTATEVRRGSHYAGDAREIALAFEQFPQGTELMHSVRYVGLDEHDQVTIPRRMKELRYMRKVNVLPRHVLENRYAKERKEKLLGGLPRFLQRGDEGLDNKLGWFVQGFIEDYDGELRPQSYEENMQCMGCHSAIGTTIDSTFSLARKVTGAPGWGYINLRGMADAPSVSESGGEILNYLRRAGGGSEFRENPEMAERWFRADGSVDEAKVRAADVYMLVAPSARRALDLNKAYTHIVRHQSFIDGRDASWVPARNVYRDIDESVAPLEGQHRRYGWDLRLDWRAPGTQTSRALP
ncbi:MAG: hypothetical protein L0Y66_16320 [Myxococcaceae bacterium]|nr:hypothetical protein [Myxococcaceae bacterium]